MTTLTSPINLAWRINLIKAFVPRLDLIFVLLTVLSGTKYGLKQTRGKFGLGAKMVLFASFDFLYSMFNICAWPCTTA